MNLLVARDGDSRDCPEKEVNSQDVITITDRIGPASINFSTNEIKETKHAP